MTRFTATRWWMLTGASVLVLIGAMQLVPVAGIGTNPPVMAEPAWPSPGTRALAERACFDCHSNATTWPGYARFAPVSWLVARDVREGRELMNFSEWQRPQAEANEAPEATREGEMPPRIYLAMHPEARLSAEEREQLARGLTLIVGPPAGEDDVR